MIRAFVCIGLMVTAGCVRCVPQAEVVRQVKACEARGGVTVVQTVDRYNDAARRVVCYLPEAQP